jgi:hypothetical protein
MVQRLAILIGGLGATAIFAVALGAAGLIPTAPAPPVKAVDVANVSAPADAAAPATDPGQPTVKKVVDKVYIAPPTPASRNAPAANTPTSPPAVASAPRGEPENDSESSHQGGEPDGNRTGGRHEGGNRTGGDD